MALLKEMLAVQGRAIDDWENAQTFEDHLRCHSAFFGIRNVFNLMVSLWSKVVDPNEVFSEEEMGDARTERPDAGY